MRYDSPSERDGWCPPVPWPAAPPPDGCGPPECVLGAVQRRHSDGRPLPDDPAAAVAAARLLWQRGAPPAWLAYAAAVVALARGDAQIAMFDQEAA